MELAADGHRLELVDPDGFTNLAVVVVGEGPRSDLAAAIAPLGALGDDGDAFLDVEALAELAGERARDPGWRSRYEGMIAYARAKGWVDGEGRVQAHVERGAR